MENNFLFNSNKKSKNSSVKSHRQLKVGEELRHLISNALLRESFYDEHIENNNITITEVNVSPDLKNAKIYVMPLGGANKLDALNSLSKAATINSLQSEVWGYKSKLETHTVETHVYRLRKKVEKKFNDKSFIISIENGYKIEK